MKSRPLRTQLAPVLALLLMSLCAPTMAMEAFQASYQASAMGMQGEGSMTLSMQGNNRWQYSLSIRNNLVDLSQKTVFDEHNGQLRPLSSSDNSRVLIKQKAVNTTYDWSKAQATWTGDVKPERAGPVALKSGDMDALLVNLAIVRDVAAGKPLNYRMVENGRAKPMIYQLAGKETIQVAGSPREATKVVRTDGNKQMIVWVVADMPVPVRILQREDGQDSIDLQLKSLR